MTRLRQILAVTWLNLTTIPQRLGSSLVIVIGIAAVTGVMISVLSMSTGFIHMMNGSARSDRVIILSGGAQYDWGSQVSRDSASRILSALGIKKDADGNPLVSPETLTGFALPSKATHADTFIALRGIGAKGLALRPELRLTGGRLFQPGARELIVGETAQIGFDGLDVGKKIRLPEGDWTIVGRFNSAGDILEGALIGDNETIMSAFRRDNFSSIIALLDSAQSFDQFKNALTADKTLNIGVERETQYNARVSQEFYAFLTLIAYLVGGVMGLGALFGALNSMYSAVSARSLEIATLRSLGFGRTEVVVSVLTEAMALALVGGLIGAGIAWLAFNGNLHSGGGAIFRLSVTFPLVLFGLGFAFFIAFLGGLLPAIRVARLPVTMALRAA